MNKVLHVLVYVFLVLAAAALYFEIQLNDKRALLKDRNQMQEDYIIRIAKTIEKQDAAKTAAPELKMDADAVEAKFVDSPNMENVLDEYNASLEQANLETYGWDTMDTREKLRQVYVMDADGKPMMDAGEPLKRGSPEETLLNSLFESAKAQQSRLNSTRAELASLRGKLEKVVEELNKIKPIARQDKVTIGERDEKIAKLEGEKTELENQITKTKAQVDELNASITSLRDEVSTAKDETQAKQDELDKSKQLVEQLKAMLKESIPTAGANSAKGVAVSSLPAGEKGKVVEADNKNMFAIVAFSDEALKELKGENLDKPIPSIELGVKRTGYQGEAGEFVGRIRLRQEVKGKPYVICDILAAWEQDKLQTDDTVFAD